MGKIIVVVESPAKCKKIEEYLGSSYRCIATFGHLRYLHGLEDIVVSDTGITLRYREIEEKKARIATLRRELKDAESVILATDNDREGEAIAWHVCDMFHLPLDTRRMVFTEITRDALNRAVKKCTSINISLVNAQKARQVLDLWIGFRISPLLWRDISSGLSAGRCQTPALRLLCDKEREVNTAWENSQLMYATHGYFGRVNARFVLDSNLEDPEPFLISTQKHAHLFKRERSSPTTHAAPVPLTTSRLQQGASTVLKTSPKETMRNAQILYEKGLITYMRTDSEAYSAEFTEKLKKHIVKKWGEDYFCQYERRIGVLAQEAHEAIHQTDLDNVPSPDLMKEYDLTRKAHQLYEYIYYRTMRSTMSSARGEALHVTLSAPSDLRYKANAERIVFNGWMAAGKEVDEENAFDDNLYNYFSSLHDDDVISYNSVSSLVKPYGLVSRLNESRVVKLLEEKGIGRPSTYASLMEKLVERKYARVGSVQGVVHQVTDYYLDKVGLSVEKSRREFGAEKARMVPLEMGVKVATYLCETTDLFSYDFTREMESKLDKVASSEIDWVALCMVYNERLNSVSEAPTPKTTTMRTLSENLSVRTGKHGTYVFYKRPTMRRPTFLNVKKFKGDVWTCDEAAVIEWLRDTYNVEVGKI